MNGTDVQHMWFQQYGTASHATNETPDILRQAFRDRITSQRGNINWPPSSCDPTPSSYGISRRQTVTLIILKRFDNILEPPSQPNNPQAIQLSR